MKRQIICVTVLYNLDHINGCALREFFFAICSLNIEYTEEKLKEIKKKQYLKLVLEVIFIEQRFLSLNSSY